MSLITVIVSPERVFKTTLFCVCPNENKNGNKKSISLIVRRCRFKVAANGQGLLQGWNSLLVCLEPLLIKDIKVQVNKQKPNSERPAQMKHNSDKMTIAPMSSQPCSKPNVSGSFSQFEMLSNQFSMSFVTSSIPSSSIIQCP